MFRTKRSGDNYLMIDHRESPGITEEQAAHAGHGTLPVGRGMVFEAATKRCGHCPAQIIMNPLRIRERGYCPKCDHYLCDACESVRVATGVCRPWQKVIDDFIDAGAKGLL